MIGQSFVTRRHHEKVCLTSTAMGAFDTTADAVRSAGWQPITVHDFYPSGIQTEVVAMTDHRVNSVVRNVAGVRDVSCCDPHHRHLLRLLNVLGINLPVDSSHLEDGTAVPQPFIDQIVAEKQAAKEGRRDPFVPHSVEGKRRAGLLACAAVFGKVRCDHKDTLALIRTNLRHLNLTLDKPKYARTRKRGADGKVLERAGVIQSITIRCKTRELQTSEGRVR